MGVLAELFSFGDGAKRKVKELLRDPAGAMEQAAGNLRDQGGRPATAREVVKDMDTMQLRQLALDFFNPAGPAAGLAGVIKSKGGNWLAGSVEDALKGLKRNNLPVGVVEANPTHPNVVAQTSVNSWIEGPLARYVKTRMASPEDEVRKLAEEGVLHIPDPGLYTGPHISIPRMEAGFPPQGIAELPLAQNWESLADQAIKSRKAQYYQQGLGEVDPWLLKVPPETPIYEAVYGHGKPDLGFSHLIDELSNASNPTSGLPREFQLSPEAVKNMGMEKAVRHVAKINAWRAAQKAEANRALAEKAALVREYTDPAMPNPKGLRWVELKTNDLPKGYKTVKEGDTLHVFDAEGREIANFVDKPGKNAAHQAKDYFGKQSLADQLRYEGETMQNCVGGYCDKVLGGESRIFSLRDAKGEPHVTVEVQPDATMLNPLGWWRDAMPPEVAARFPRPTNDLNNAFLKWQDAIRTSPEYRAYVENFVPAQRIEQIKYKQNSTKPVQDYLPFVQDFVRNSPLGGKWADVRDLESAALYPRRVLAAEEQATFPDSDYLTLEQIQQLRAGKPWTPIDTDPDF